MKFKDLKDKNAAELGKVLKEQEEKLREFRFGLAGARSKDVKLGANTRKTIARIKTLLVTMK